MSTLLTRMVAWLTGQRGPIGPPVASEPSESDVGYDPRLVGSRPTGGQRETLSSDSGSVTGTGATGVFVGQVAGDDLGYAEPTGAEARHEADRDPSARPELAPADPPRAPGASAGAHPSRAVEPEDARRGYIAPTPADAGQARADREMAEAERTAARGTASEAQAAGVDRVAPARSHEARRRLWTSPDSPPQH